MIELGLSICVLCCDWGSDYLLLKWLLYLLLIGLSHERLHLLLDGNVRVVRAGDDMFALADTSSEPALVSVGCLKVAVGPNEVQITWWRKLCCCSC